MPFEVSRLKNPSGIGGCECYYTVLNRAGTDKIEGIQGPDLALCIAEMLAKHSGERWDVVEHKTSHSTVAAYDLAVTELRTYSS